MRLTLAETSGREVSFLEFAWLVHIIFIMFKYIAGMQTICCAACWVRYITYIRGHRHLKLMTEKHHTVNADNWTGLMLLGWDWTCQGVSSAAFFARAIKWLDSLLSCLYTPYMYFFFLSHIYKLLAVIVLVSCSCMSPLLSVGLVSWMLYRDNVAVLTKFLWL